MSGTAEDTGIGITANISNVQVLYYERSAGAGAAAFWSTNTQSYSINLSPSEGEIGGSPLILPTTGWLNVTNITGCNPTCNWSATGASTPTFTTGNTYRIFARAIDQLGNVTNVASDYVNTAANSPHIEFAKAAATPDAVITAPAGYDTWYRASAGANQLTQITGTASDAAYTRLQIMVSTGSDNAFTGESGDTDDNMCWTQGSAWLRCADNVTLDASFNKNSSTYSVFSVNTGPDPDDWTCSFTAGVCSGLLTAWPNNRYFIRTFAFSGATDEGTALSTRSFRVDDTNPTLTLSSPNPAFEGYRLGQLTELKGTANDTGGNKASSVNDATVFFKITMSSDSSTAFSRAANGYVKNPSDANIPYDTKVGVEYSTAPTYLERALLEGYTLKVTLSASDNAQNAPTPTSVSFYYDTLTPTATIKAPDPNITGGISSLSTLSGTVYDKDPNGDVAISPSGIPYVLTSSGVEVSIQRQLDLNYFNQAGCPGTCWLPPASVKWWPADVQTNVDWTLQANATWTYTNANLEGQIESGKQYMVRARAMDKGGNQQQNFFSSGTYISSVTVRIDKEAPTLTVTKPQVSVGYYHIGGGETNDIKIANVTGESQDGPAVTAAGLKQVDVDDVNIKLWFLDSGTTYYWANQSPWWTTTPSSFTRGASGSGIGSPATWSFDVADPDGCTPPAINCVDWQWTNGDTIAQDKTFYVAVRGQDNAVSGSSAAVRNLSVFHSTVSFVVDDTVPLSTFTVPASGVRYINSLNSIQGTLDASSSGATDGAVSIRIKRLSDGHEWAGSSWTNTANIWSTATVAGNNWTYSRIYTSTFSDDADYDFWVRVIDQAGNLQTEDVKRHFEFDFTTPTASLILPSDIDEQYNSAYTSGNYPPLDDQDNNSITDSTKTITNSIIIDDYVDSGGNAGGLNDGWVAIGSGTAPPYLWWRDFSGKFDLSQSTPHWVQATSVYLSSFIYSGAALSGQWRDGVTYRVIAKVKSLAGNWGGATEVTPSSNDCETNSELFCQVFVYDSTAPVSGITTPAVGYVNSDMNQFTGIAADSVGAGPSGLRAVKVAVRRCSDATCNTGNFWNWNNPGAFSVAITENVTWADVGIGWSTGVPSGMLVEGNTYYVVARAVDYATNEEQDGIGQGRQFLYDITDPRTAIVLPQPSTAYWNLPMITGTFADNLSPMTTIQVVLQDAADRYYNGTSFNTTLFNANQHWRGVTAYASSWTFIAPTSLFSSNADYKVWIRGEDAAGNEDVANTEPSAGSARLLRWDTQQPVSVATAPANNSAGRNPVFIFAGTAADLGGAGVRNVKFRVLRNDNTWLNVINKVFDGATGNNTSNFPFSTNGTTIWSRNLSSDHDLTTEGYRYQTITRSLDNSRDGSLPVADPDEYRQYETVFTSSSYVIDNSTPTFVINTPEQTFPGFDFVTSISTFSGVVTDTVNFSADRIYEAGIATRAADQSIMVGIKQLRDEGLWWNPASSTFSVVSSTPYWGYGQIPNFFNDGTSVVGKSSGTWEFYVNASRLQNNTSYYINVMVKDTVGNMSNVYSTGAFIVDTSTPDATVSYPAPGDECNSNMTAFPSIDGTASDTPIGELEVVSLRIIRQKTGVTTQDCDASGAADGSCWDGANWVSCGAEPGIWIDSGVVTASDWTYTIPSGFLGQNTVYTIWARAKDKAGNYQGVTLPTTGDTGWNRRVRFTENVPVTLVIKPQAKRYRDVATALETITGTSANALDVAVRINRRSDNYDYRQYTSSGEYLPGTFWHTPVSTGGAGGQWTFTGPGVKVTTHAWSIDNTSYTIRSRGCSPGGQGEPSGTPCSNQAGNSGITVYIDTHAPVAVTTFPVVNAIRSLTVIAGTVVDGNTYGKNTADSVRFRITRDPGGPDQAFYDPGFAGKWGPAAPVGDLTGYGPESACNGIECTVVNWSTASVAADGNGWLMATGYNYDITVYATDEAGNVSGLDTKSVVYDTAPPVAVTTQPVPGYVYKDLFLIAGTAAESALPSPRNNVSGLALPNANEVRVERGDRKTFNGNGFFSGDTWVVALGTQPWI
ncbi:MAG: hypothetical protein AABZ44_08990, partial [Elusimicrobiota bacterium]